MKQLIETRRLYTDFYTFEGVVKALNGVNVVINRGETYGIVGESGCGKSVTVRSMMRIVQSPGKITDGCIILFFDDKEKSKGIDILERSEAYMASIRGNDISMIFQEASTSLNPVLSIGYQVGESFYFHRLDQMLEETLSILSKEIGTAKFFLAKGWKSFQTSLFKLELQSLRKYQAEIAEIDKQLYLIEDKEDQASLKRRVLLNRKRDRLKKENGLVQFVRHVPFIKRYSKKLDKTVQSHVVDLLKSLGVPNPERIVCCYPHELSGGMQQRIVIAIALACHPVLLIADEPTSNLDVTIQAQIIDLIKTLKEKIISSVLFITHDLGLVAEMCDRATVMYAGDVAETAAVKEIFHNPLHPYTQGLMRSVPKVHQTGELNIIPGNVPNLIHPPAGCRFHPRCPNIMEICPKEKPPTIEHSTGHFVACYLYTDGKNEPR
ncbi:MAG: ABC transporter ATP-binding protein [Spirochaetota bacterium]